jgi:poly(A) polymerase
VIDHAGGLGDLKRRYVRAIGDPEIRFREDPIRILRAIKFAARLDFEIEGETREALLRHRTDIPKAAAPRILEEINRFCRGGAARRSFDLMRDTQVFDVVLPEFAEGYGRQPDEWERCCELLEAIDRRNAKGHEVTTGAILAALMLPLIRERIGWSLDGTAEQADEILQPMAERLRAARKDQERCRQLMLTLFRMVPARRVRRNTRRSILGRECMPDAMWILETWAERHGGQFAESLEYWQRAAKEERDVVPEETRPSRRRGRRGGRRRSGQGRGDGDGGERKRQPRPRKPRREPEADKGAPAENMPSPWDEKYFFAALPSVPEMQTEEQGTDRYGAGSVAADSEQPASEETAAGTEASGETKGTPRPRRRRRRRGGRGRGGTGRSKTGDAT